MLPTRPAVLQELAENAILAECGGTAVEFNQEGLVIERAGERETIPAEVAMLPVGMVPKVSW